MDRTHTTSKLGSSKSGSHCSSKTPPARLEGGFFRSPEGGQIFSLFGPLHYEPRYAYPLIVWLHAPGTDEQQLMRVMPLVSMRNYVAVAPQGLPIDGRGAASSEALGWPETEDAVLEAAQRVFGAVHAAAEKFHVAADRVFLAGFDAGGTMALRLALGWPQRFAGVASFGGRFPRSGRPLANFDRVRHLAVFLAVGRRSTRYPTERLCADLRLLHTAGMWVTLRQYPYGHELAPQMLSDMDRWIIEQITARPNGRVPVEEPPESEA